MTAKEVTAIVRQIITEGIAKDGRISKYFVIEEVKNRINTTEVFNWFLTDPKPPSLHNGIDAMHHGAKRIYRTAMKTLTREYEVDKTSWITLRAK